MSEKIVIFEPSGLYGEIKIPPSKSDVHRAVICAALAKGKSVISPVALSNDIKASISCAEALGAEIRYENETLTVDGGNVGKNKTAVLNCGESGSTLRFFIPIAAAFGINVKFNGEGRLPKRPIGIYLDELPKHGVECKTNGGLPLEINGKLTAGKFNIPGNISSQFITGFLLSLPLLENDSEIVITTELESAGYIDMTLDVMKRFGIKVQKTENGYYISGGQEYIAADYITEGDWSQAAFFLCAGALKNRIGVSGLLSSSTQRDKEIATVLRRFGASVSVFDDMCRCASSELIGINIDAKQIPDLVPVIAVVAGLCRGQTIIYNAERLRIKESDRLSAIANAINLIGGNAKETKDGLIITGVEQYRGCERSDIVDGCNDHRIIMAMAVAAVRTQLPIKVSYPESIKKSYPDFYEDYNRLGGAASVVNLRK